MKYIIILTGLVAIGCLEGTNNTSIVNIKDSQGKLISRVSYINDSIKHGLSTYYYHDGKIKEEIQYLNGKLNGINKVYSKNGVINEITNYSENFKNGKSIEFFPSGKIDRISNWIKGNQYGDTYSYYMNGKIKLYNSYSFSEHCQVVAKYDSLTGNLLYRRGPILADIKSEYDLDSIPINSPFEISFCVPNPPGVTTQIFVLLDDGKLIKHETIKIQKNTATWKSSLSKPKLTIIKFVGQYLNPKKEVLQTETLAVYQTGIETIKPIKKASHVYGRNKDSWGEILSINKYSINELKTN